MMEVAPAKQTGMKAIPEMEYPSWVSSVVLQQE
jgi:hypothetical protein